MQVVSRQKIEELVENHREGLILFIYRYVNDLDTAEDLAEDVFVEILLHPDRFRNASSEKTYLYAIGRNKAVDFIRKHKRLVFMSDRDDDSLDSDITYLEKRFYDDATLVRMAEESDPAHKMIRDEEIARLRTAMDTIKKEYSEALSLVYFEEMTYEQAGKVLGKDRKQIENLVYRGKKSLAKAIEQMTKEGIQ